ncbi:MAG: hypothetical protein ACRDY7_14210 [Acidimicrobiia bacterium]
MILVALMWTQFPLGGGAHAEGGPALKLCCAWGRTLADADLTWSVAGADSATADVIRSGLREWDDVLASVSLTEVSPGTRKIDVVITFTEDPGRTEGQAVTSFTERGLIKKVEVGIQGARAPANTGGLLQITKHEFGHALGLGHANFDGNLMSEAVSPQPSPIEGCVMSAVIEANRWRLIDPQEKRPQRPIVDEVAC